MDPWTGCECWLFLLALGFPIAALDLTIALALGLALDGVAVDLAPVLVLCHVSAEFENDFEGDLVVFECSILDLDRVAGGQADIARELVAIGLQIEHELDVLPVAVDRPLPGAV